MCAVNRVLMKQQEQQKSPEMEALPPEGGQEERQGTEPTSGTQVLSSALALSLYFIIFFQDRVPL